MKAQAKRHCRQCCKPAKVLPKLLGSTREAFFCSAKCAAIYGMKMAESTEYWCEKHGWADEGVSSNCDQCEEEAELGGD